MFRYRFMDQSNVEGYIQSDDQKVVYVRISFQFPFGSLLLVW